MGTPWLEMWIGYELECGSVPGRHEGGEVCPLTPRPTARALFRTFVAALRALLHGALAEEDFIALVEGGARGLAYRHFAVASTLSTLGWCVHRSAGTQREVHMRLLRLRGMS